MQRTVINGELDALVLEFCQLKAQLAVLYREDKKFGVAMSGRAPIE